jgi:hypothetical protein
MERGMELAIALILLAVGVVLEHGRQAEPDRIRVTIDRQR